MKTKNHGWIYIEREPAGGVEPERDKFWVLHDGDRKFMGYGVYGSEAACDYFENIVGLGSIKLVDLGRLGYRVYTEEEEVGDVYQVDLPEHQLQHLKQVGVLEKSTLDRLCDFVDAITHLSESWAEDPISLEQHYPKGWPNFEEMVGDAIEWANKVKGKE
jgi:hypothetical protein